MTTSIPVDAVGRAVAAVDKAMARLIGLLKSKDEATRRGAAEELVRMDAFALGHLIQYVFESKDTALKVRIVRAMGRFGPELRDPIMTTFAGVFHLGDAEVKRAVMAVVSGMSPPPPEPAPPDPASPAKTEPASGR